MGANATTINEQANKQRESIKNRNNTSGSSEDLGVSRFSILSATLFNSFDAQEILSKSKEEFDSLTAGPLGSNPDFEEEVSLEYLKGADLYSSVQSKKDKPNTKGPQLKTIKIGDNGEPDTENSDLDLKDKLLKVKDKLLRMSYNDESSPTDRNNIYNLKTSVSE